MQGLRFDLVNGVPAFTIGVEEGERGDVTLEISAAAARELNSLYTSDPAYHAALARMAESGEIRVTGDLSPMMDWLHAIHDPIVDHTV
ncbi:hypothetical protein [Acidisoma sp. 7E03]